MRIVNRPPRRYWHDQRGSVFWLVCVCLVLGLAYSVYEPAGPERLDEGLHQVRRVIDGDTILLTSGARVRLQGINTPETIMPNHPAEAWRPQASQFIKDFIEKAGHRVRLTFSPETQRSRRLLPGIRLGRRCNAQ